MSSPLAAGAWWAAANVGTPTSMAPITAPTRPPARIRARMPGARSSDPRRSRGEPRGRSRWDGREAANPSVPTQVTAATVTSATEALEVATTADNRSGPLRIASSCVR